MRRALRASAVVQAAKAPAAGADPAQAQAAAAGASYGVRKLSSSAGTAADSDLDEDMEWVEWFDGTSATTQFNAVTDCAEEVLHATRAGKVPPPDVARGSIQMPTLDGPQLAEFHFRGKPGAAVQDMFYGNFTEITRADWSCQCTMRYKLHQGRLYAADTNMRPPCTADSADLGEKRHTQFFEEMLLLALWAFPELSARDFDVAYTAYDVNLCPVRYPLLTHAVTDATDGVAIPIMPAWFGMGMSREQLWQNIKCIHDGSGRPEFRSKEPRVFWRGHLTGFASFPDSPQRMAQLRRLQQSTNASSHLLAYGFQRPRFHAVVSAVPFDFLDVKLLNDSMLAGMLGSASSEFAALLVGEETPMLSWGHYAMQLGLDGFGPAHRELLQLLAPSVLLRSASRMRLWYHHLLKPGEHVETFDADNMDLVQRSHALISEFKSDPTRLERQVAAMNAFAVEHLNFEAQLRALVWAILKADQLAGQRPHMTPGFSLVKRRPSFGWTRFLPRAVRQAVIRDLPENFVPATASGAHHMRPQLGRHR